MDLIVKWGFVLFVQFSFSNIWAVEEGDFEREQRLKDEIVETLFDGDPIDLNANGHDFLAIFTEADEAKGVIVMTHGRGFHPDWPEAINPLRVGLSERGWSTLSLQMPVLLKGSRYYDYEPLFDAASNRIDAGISYLQTEGFKKIILLAHSCGAHMAMHRVRNKGSDDLAAYIGLGMGATDYRQLMAQPFPLDKIKVPVLDVYGEVDYPAVLEMAPERAAMMKTAGNPYSKQILLEGSDHYFTDMGDSLTQVVGDWLDTLH